MTEYPVYLDYQATTPIDPEVRKVMLPYLDRSFGNPHSVEHQFGWSAAEAVQVARAQVANLIGADDDEIVFCSGATESCNLALRGAAHASDSRERRQIVTLATEHSAVLETVLDLSRTGFKPVILPVGKDGILDLDVLDGALDERTLMVSVMAANNEIGVLQPIPEIASRCHAVGALFHTDATQAVGSIPIDVNAWEVDLMSFSGHKVYGPMGIGALYVRTGVRLAPVITGGFQERGGVRSGTLPTPLVAGFGAACDLAYAHGAEDQTRIRGLADRLFEGLCESYPTAKLFGHSDKRLTGNLNVGIPGIPAEAIIRSVAGKIAISSGSACSSANTEPSRVILALGFAPEVAATAFRIGLGRFTTEEHIAIAKSALHSINSTGRT